MLLAIDVGNTQTVVGCMNQKIWVHTWRISTHPLCTSDELTLKLGLLLKSVNIDLEDIQSIVVSSVVPSFTRVMQSSFSPEKLHLIDLRWPFSFSVKASPPEQVGADRLVNAEAAVREYGAPVIIVDSGTATTICAVGKSASGHPEYLGGAILAGIELSMQALAKNAAQLFTIELTPPQRVIGQNTQEALKSGILMGYSSMIDGMIQKFRIELNQPDIPVIATGGISYLMKGLAKELTHFDSNLTLKGIAYLYESFCNR